MNVRKENEHLASYSVAIGIQLWDHIRYNLFFQNNLDECYDKIWTLTVWMILTCDLLCVYCGNFLVLVILEVADTDGCIIINLGS